jgi:hypothetical protein
VIVDHEVLDYSRWVPRYLKRQFLPQLIEMAVRNRQRKPVKLANVPKRLIRADLERRLPLRGGHFRNLTGHKFQYCTVIGLAGFLANYSAWLCRCVCGQLFVARSSTLAHRPTGCGCAGGTRQRHGDSSSTEHGAWLAMLATHPQDVSDRWHIYRNFLQDVGRRPGAGYGLCRIDVRKPFGRGNAAWRRMTEKRSPQKRALLAFGGKQLSKRQWADRLGITYEALRQRLIMCERGGVNFSEALTTRAGETMPFKTRRVRPWHPKPVAR